jgi:hypothetical protein
MMRTLVATAALALAILPPVFAFGAPVQGYRVAPAQQQQVPRAAMSRSASQDAFKVPMELNVLPKPAARESDATVLPYRFQGSQVAGEPVWIQPSWYQNGCFAQNVFGTAPAFQNDGSSLASTTLGSLADDRSKHLISTTPSYNPSSPSGSSGLATSNQTGLSLQVQPTQCGSSRLINF